MAVARMLAAVAVAAMVVAACGPAGSYVVGGTCRPPAPPNSEVQGSFEEANLVAAGEAFRIYGTEADPARVTATGEVVEVADQPVWRVEATFEVTIDQQRRTDAWVFWVGFEQQNELVVLCVQGPDDVAWLPAGAE